MRFLQTLFNSIIIFCLLIIIGALLSLFVPALANSMNKEEVKRRDQEEAKLMQLFLEEDAL